MELKDLYNLFVSSKGISTDTRSLKQGQIFFALRGPNHDGNRYAADALAAGAMASVVDDHSIKGDKIIMVNDTLDTMTQLAVMHRQAIKAPVIAITGTNGKTTTKELVSEVLSKNGKVHSTSGNLNNHLGVPLTILGAAPDVSFLVIEMGANHKGEIAALCETARPTHGIITNIGKAHLEGFGNFESVVEAKSELYHWLRNNNGIAFYNEHNNTLRDLIYHIVHKAVPYSDPTGTDLVVTGTVNEDLFLKVHAEFEGRKHDFETHLFGSYNLDNVRAAMAVGLFFGVPVESVIEAISGYKPANNRSQVMQTGRNTIICDSYNANPSSMLKALSAFSETRAKKKMVILGDMLELGTHSEDEHNVILKFLEGLEDTDIFLVGPVFSSLVKKENMKSFSSSEALREVMYKKHPEDYLVLVKGSRGMLLEKLYEAL